MGTREELVEDLPPVEADDEIIQLLRRASEKLKEKAEQEKDREFWAAVVSGMAKTIECIIKDLEEDNERGTDAG